MDLGTANTIIIHNDKIVVDEPSIVAIEEKTGKLVAVGDKARQMHGKTHEGLSYRRLQRCRAHDSRYDKDGEQEQKLDKPIAEDGYRRAVGKYRSRTSCCTRLVGACRWT